MGSLICLRCKARVDASTKEEAEKVIDHAVGLTRGIKCGGNLARLEWTDGGNISITQTTKSDDEETIASPKKAKKKSSK